MIKLNGDLPLIQCDNCTETIYVNKISKGHLKLQCPICSELLVPHHDYVVARRAARLLIMQRILKKLLPNITEDFDDRKFYISEGEIYTPEAFSAWIGLKDRPKFKRSRLS